MTSSVNNQSTQIPIPSFAPTSSERSTAHKVDFFAAEYFKQNLSPSIDINVKKIAKVVLVLSLIAIVGAYYIPMNATAVKAIKIASISFLSLAILVHVFGKNYVKETKNKQIDFIESGIEIIKTNNPDIVISYHITNEVNGMAFPEEKQITLKENHFDHDSIYKMAITLNEGHFIEISTRGENVKLINLIEGAYLLQKYPHKAKEIIEQQAVKAGIQAIFSPSLGEELKEELKAYLDYISNPDNHIKLLNIRFSALEDPTSNFEKMGKAIYENRKPLPNLDLTTEEKAILDDYKDRKGNVVYIYD
ncbi:MAG: hypothetical protein ACOVOR_00995 [Rhabdochlamydiaceae bacterium]